MNFIELTQNGKKFMGNINLLQRVIDNGKGRRATIVGWTNNGSFDVDEDYQTVINLIKSNTQLKEPMKAQVKEPIKYPAKKYLLDTIDKLHKHVTGYSNLTTAEAKRLAKIVFENRNLIWDKPYMKVSVAESISAVAVTWDIKIKTIDTIIFFFIFD